MNPAKSRPGACDRLRTVFISDLHLGFRGCQAEYLLEFLEQLATDQLVLVGDIVDLWSLKKSLYWPLAHQAVVRQILKLARDGTKVIYVPGNHDEECRELCGAEVAGIEIRRDFIHEAADGIIFLHKVAAGSADKSYGIHVARLAGVPEPVLDRANAVLATLESPQKVPTRSATRPRAKKPAEPIDPPETPKLKVRVIEQSLFGEE